MQTIKAACTINLHIQQDGSADSADVQIQVVGITAKRSELALKLAQAIEAKLVLFADESGLQTKINALLAEKTHLEATISKINENKKQADIPKQAEIEPKKIFDHDKSAKRKADK